MAADLLRDAEMEFNVAQLLLSPTGGVREYDLDDDISGLDPQIVPHSNLVGRVKFTHAGLNVLVEGRVRIDLELVCARCAEPFIQQVTIDLLEEFEPLVDVLTGRVLPTVQDDPALIIDDHNILNLREVVRQNLLLAIEEYPHCREDCPGLCPYCGANLGEGACGCSEMPTDPRWATLAELRDKTKS
jgi:uncharacterized metal-binding protein YceD (DUF177 family)